MKLVIRLFNLIYIVLAAVACTCLLTRPIVLIDSNLALPKQNVTNLIYPSLKDQVSEEDWNRCLVYSLDENNNLRVDLKLEIPSIQLFTKNADEVTQQLTDQITVTLNQFVDKLRPTIKELAKVIATNNAKESIKDSIAEQIKANSTDDSTDAYAIMESCGIDDEYIENMTEEIFDDLLGTEDQEPVETVDELMDCVDDYVDEICHMLADNGVDGYSTDDEELEKQIAEMSDTIQQQLEDKLQEAGLADEDGNIMDIDEAIDELLATMLDELFGTAETETEEGSEQTEEVPEEEKLAKRVVMVSAEGEEEKESKLTLKIKEILNQKLAEFDLKGKITQYKFIPYIMIAVLLLPWIVFIVLTLIRTIRKTKVWTKSWVIFSFAFIQVILGVILYLATAKFMTQLLGLIPDIDNPAIDILKYSSLSVKTGTFIPSILYLAMIPLTIVYVILCHKIKKEYKQEKVEKKLSKKSA